MLGNIFVGESTNSKGSTGIVAEANKEGKKVLLEPEAKRLCSQYGIPVTKFRLVKRRDEVLAAAEEVGYPVVLKIISPDIIHKSDVGGVILNLRTSQEVSEAYNELFKRISTRVPRARIEGVLVEEMAPQGMEVIVGVKKDPQFGPVLMFGLGGIFVEILKDVSFRVAPITELDALDMIKEVRAYPVLKGYRNQPPSDVDAIIDILMNLSKLVTEHPEIQELDLNPIFVYEKGAKAVDARIILK